MLIVVFKINVFLHNVAFKAIEDGASLTLLLCRSTLMFISLRYMQCSCKCHNAQILVNDNVLYVTMYC